MALSSGTGAIGSLQNVTASSTGSSTAGTTPLTTTSSSKLNLNTQGWWMFAGITTAILLGSTPLAPFAFGILTVALVYQTGLLLEGK